MDTKVQTSISAAKRMRYVYLPTLSVMVWTSPLRPMTMSVKIGRKIPDKVKPARPDKKSLPLLSPKSGGKIRLPAPKYVAKKAKPKMMTSRLRIVCLLQESFIKSPPNPIIKNKCIIQKKRRCPQAAPQFTSYLSGIACRNWHLTVGRLPQRHRAHPSAALDITV